MDWLSGMRTACSIVFLLLVLAGGPVARAQEEPVPAKLTIRIPGDPGWMHVPSSMILRVTVAGAAFEPGSTATLVDASGEHAISVEGLSPSACEDEPLRSTGVGTVEWCLQFRGIEAGQEYTGTVTPPLPEGAEETVTALGLTVKARHHFIGAPLLASIFAVGLGALWAWWTGTRLRRVVASSLLRVALAKNRGTGGRELVKGLEQRVAELKQRGKSDEDLRTLVLAATGPDRDRGTVRRAALGMKLQEFAEQHPGWETTPLLSAAAQVRNREDLVDDFYTTDGARVAAHPADTWITTLESAHLLLLQLGRARQALAELRPPRPDLEPQVGLVDETLRRARGAEGIEEARGHLSRLWEDIYGSRPAEATLGMIAGAEDEPVGAEPPTAMRPAERAWLAIVVTIAGFLVVALAGVLSGTYAANHTFGTAWDYLGLIVAAFASTAVAGIVAAVALSAVTQPK